MIYLLAVGKGGEGVKKYRKILLVALDSKYVHTNLAVQYIKAYSEKMGVASSEEIEIFESTVNRPERETIDVIASKKPDIIAFSCYIWNISYIKQVGQALKERLPETVFVLGGPEVGFAPEMYLPLDWVDFVISGDGERPFSIVLQSLAGKTDIPDGFGICYKNEGKCQYSTPFAEKELSVLADPYTDEYLKSIKGRIAYFEASRGCPFSCAFCLSGAACSGVRNFDMTYVKESLVKLWNSGVKTVKFVDRTFNADVRRADEILSFLLQNAPNMPQDVCFHFEVAADLLKESTLTLLEKAPAGLFQIEAGVQSFHSETLKAVTRVSSLEKLSHHVKRLCKNGNVHVHVDLIAGLPYECFSSFKESFNKAYALGADMLQLGFLKLLYGSALRKSADADGTIQYHDKPPYEVTCTAWLTSSELETLHGVADACDKLHNSGRFREALDYLLSATGMMPFDLFGFFGGHEPMPLDDFYEAVYRAFGSLPGVSTAILRDKLCRDRLATNASARLPECLKIYDARLAAVTDLLPKIPEYALRKGYRRAVCLLYSEQLVIYADYPAEKCEKDCYTVHTVTDLKVLQTAFDIRV